MSLNSWKMYINIYSFQHFGLHLILTSWTPFDSERRRLNSKNRLRKRDYILFLCITLYSEEKQWSEKENYCRNTWRWCIMIHEPHNPSAWLASEWSDSIEVWFSNRWNWKTFNSINQNEAMTFKSRSLIRSRLQNILYCFFLDVPGSLLDCQHDAELQSQLQRDAEL